MIARYWSLLITSSVAGGNIAVGNLEFRASIGGPALTGTAIASVAQSGFPASNVLDGDPTTAWASNNTIPARIGIDLVGSPSDVAEFMLQAWSNFSFGNLTPKDFQLQFSPDNVSWSPAGRFPPQWRFTEPTWAASQARTYSYPLPANEEAYKITHDALLGASDRLAVAKITHDALLGASDRLAVAKITHDALTGADDRLAAAKIAHAALTGADSRLAVAKVGQSALTGASPYLSMAAVRVSVLLTPVVIASRGRVQIIGG